MQHCFLFIKQKNPQRLFFFFGVCFFFLLFFYFGTLGAASCAVELCWVTQPASKYVAQAYTLILGQREWRSTGKEEQHLSVYKCIRVEDSAWPWGGFCWVKHCTRCEFLESFQGLCSESDQCGSTGIQWISPQETYTCIRRLDRHHINAAQLCFVKGSQLWFSFFLFK